MYSRRSHVLAMTSAATLGVATLLTLVTAIGPVDHQSATLTPALASAEGWTPAVLAGDSAALVQFCFDKSTPPDEVAYYHQLVFGAAGPRYFLGSRWSGTQGSPRTVTWSLVPDGTTIGDSTGGVSNLFAQMDSKFAAQGGRATWINRVQQCFDRWQELCGISFTRITNGVDDWDDGATWATSIGIGGVRGDIRICGRTLGAGGTLAYAYLPSNGDVLLDMSEGYGGSTNSHRFFRNTLTHELGHSIGMFHICSGNSSQLMEPFINTSFDGPRHDDIRAGQRHYGDIFENDNSSADPTDAGPVEVGLPINLGAVPPPIVGTSPTSTSILSIDANGEQDFYRFTVAGPRVASVSVTPQGITYDNQQQNFNGSCPACCSDINTLTFVDLEVQILDTDGATVLGTADAAAAGVAETLSGVSLPAAGDYFVRVYEEGNPSQSQLYLLNITVENVPCESPGIDPLADDSTVCSVAYTSATPTASGTPPLTWSLGGSPPAGMTIDPDTGVVSWPSPVAALSPYNIVVEAASDCGGGSDSASFDLTVAPGDFDGDGLITLADMTPFVEHLLELSGVTPCAADVDLSGQANGIDVQPFVGGF